MDITEFKQTLLPINQKLFRLSYRFLGNLQEAEDAVQEVYLKLLGMRDKLGTLNNVEAFATTVTKNHCLDKIKGKRTVSLDDPLLSHTLHKEMAQDPDKDLENQENITIMKRIIDMLPDQQKCIIVMRDLEQYDFAEIQEITGLDINNIRVNLSRARKKVKEEMTKIHEYGTERNKETSRKIL